MLKLKLQYFGHLMWRANSLERPWCWERLKVGGEGDDRGLDGWMESLTWTWFWASSRSWWWQWQCTPVLLPGKSHGQRRLVGCSPWGRWESDTTEWLHFHFSLSCIGEGNGNPLQYSCLENPRDGGAWWAAVYGVAQSWTWLKRVSSSRSRETWCAAVHEVIELDMTELLNNSNNIIISDLSTLNL